MATTQSTADRFTEALEKLERQLELPYVPGELNAWADDVQTLLLAVEGPLKELVTNDHPTSFSKILQTDLELFRRVEQMKQADADLIQTLDTIKRLSTDLADDVDEKTADAEFSPDRDRLVTDGLQFVLQARKQLAAIDTWLGESIHRDTGNMD